MKNKEYYNKEFLDLLIKSIGVNKATGKPFLCDSSSERCKNCLFKDKKYCELQVIQWLEEEHKETIKLSEAEKVILSSLDNAFKYIARNKEGILFLYTEKPYKRNSFWRGDFPTKICSFKSFNHLFQFVKWEDEEPYNIQELLENHEVQVNV